MFPFCSCVCQDYSKWIIICNNVSSFLQTNDSDTSYQKNKSELVETSTQIQFQKPDKSDSNSTVPDVTTVLLPHTSTNIDISYSGSYLTTLSPFSSNYCSKNCEDTSSILLSEAESQLIEQASATRDRRKLVKIQRNKKYNRRRQSINYFQRIRICIADKCGLVDLTNHNFAQKYLEKYVDTWNFNVFRMNRFTGGNFTLTSVGLKIFENQNLIRRFSLDIESLKRFLHVVEEIYHCFNPYHNALHSIDVAQAMHCFLLDPKIKVISESIDVLSAIIAALCHDADHPGLNQIHLEKTNHFFVTLYNHNSVLENHHFRVTMSILHQTSLLKSLSSKEWKIFSSNIYNMIMATDITHQKSYLNKFMNFLHEKKVGLFSLQTCTKEEKCLVYQMALKCADIGNPCRCWPVTLGWASLVCEEFFLQGDIEKTQGLSVMSTYDRCMTTKADIQLGFIRFIVRPLITQWNIFLKSNLSALLMKYVDINLSKWEIYKQTYSTVSAKVVHNSTQKIDLTSVNCSNLSSTSPMSGLATLTEETTLMSSCVTKGCSTVHRRLSLPENVFNSPIKPPKHRLSTTMITFGRPSLSVQIPSCRRGSLPQHSRASSASNNNRRRGSLPSIVRAFPIPSAWEETNGNSTIKRGVSVTRPTQNASSYMQRRRGSAPIIGSPLVNQDWKGTGFGGYTNCFKEQLLLEVYWMTASSSVSSTNSVNAGSANNIPPLYLSSSSGSSRNDSASGTITIR